MYDLKAHFMSSPVLQPGVRPGFFPVLETIPFESVPMIVSDSSSWLAGVEPDPPHLFLSQS